MKKPIILPAVFSMLLLPSPSHSMRADPLYSNSLLEVEDVRRQSPTQQNLELNENKDPKFTFDENGFAVVTYKETPKFKATQIGFHTGEGKLINLEESKGRPSYQVPPDLAKEWRAKGI